TGPPSAGTRAHGRAGPPGRSGKVVPEIADLEVGAVVDGTVQRITPYGAFLQLEGGRVGLVHISEIDRNYVKDVHDHLRENDVVARQLGREPTAGLEVAAPCVDADGDVSTHPLVIRNHPVGADGLPFPTMYSLTCTEAVKSVSRLESTGEIGRLNVRFDHDEE